MDNKFYSNIKLKSIQTYQKEITPVLKEFDCDCKKIGSIEKFSGFFMFFGTYLLSPSIILMLLASIYFKLNLLYFCYLARAVFVIIIIGLLVSLIQKEKKMELIKKAKRNLMRIYCKCFDNLRWIEQCDSKGYREDLLKTDLFPMEYFDGVIFDDNFTGNFHNTGFEISEIYTYNTKKYNESSGKKFHKFKGVVIKIKMEKNFKGKTIIRPDTIAHKSPNNLLRHTILEDIEFEKKYDIFTNDEIEARYLITTSFMERFNNIKTSFKVNRISCSFYNKHLYIALHTNQNLFEPFNSNKSFEETNGYAKEFVNTANEIISIYKLIDYLKLDNKTRL